MDANAPNAPRKAKASERSKQAVMMRIAGATFEQIAERLGITAQSAYGLVSRALEKTRAQTAESAETLRQMEIQRLDAMQAAIWSDAMKGDEQKIDRLLKIQTRRAALLGLDAPTKQEMFARVEKVEAYEYGAAIAVIAGRSGGDSETPGDDKSNLNGPSLGEVAHGG